MRRRQVLRWGVGLGAVAGVGGVVARVVLPPRPSDALAPVPELAARLYEALDEETRSYAVVPYDHPLRQYHNRGVDTAGVWSVTLGGRARSLLVDLFYASLSEQGRERIPNQFFLSVPGIHATRLLFAGRPDDEHYQVLVTGPHLNLRIGGRSQEGVAFGGPQVYGDQRGDGDVGLPGNVYQYQLRLGQELVESLSPAERQVVRQPLAPPQTSIEVRGASGRFDGISLSDLSVDQRRRARELIGAILANYEPADVAYAWECIDANGGIEAFHLADYEQDFQGGRLAGGAPSQVIRLESPAAVFHYRGEPHLHALFNVAMDGDRPLSLGEDLGDNPHERDVEGVARLFEEVMRAQPESEIGFYPRDAVAGRLRAGPIRSGDIYNLESWRENVVFLEVEGAALAGRAGEAVRRRDRLDDKNSYRLTTIGHVADNAEEYGITRVNSEDTGPPLRDAAIAHFRAHGFPA